MNNPIPITPIEIIKGINIDVPRKDPNNPVIPL